VFPDQKQPNKKTHVSTAMHRGSGFVEFFSPLSAAKAAAANPHYVEGVFFEVRIALTQTQ